MASKIWLPKGTYVIDFTLYRPQVAVFKRRWQVEKLMDRLGHGYECIDGALGITGMENHDSVGHFIWCYIPDGAGVNTVVHESAHVANRLMAMVGWSHDQMNDEPFAYLIGYIAEKLFKVQSLPMHRGKPLII